MPFMTVKTKNYLKSNESNIDGMPERSPWVEEKHSSWGMFSGPHAVHEQLDSICVGRGLELLGVQNLSKEKYMQDNSYC